MRVCLCQIGTKPSTGIGLEELTTLWIVTACVPTVGGIRRRSSLVSSSDEGHHGRELPALHIADHLRFGQQACFDVGVDGRARQVEAVCQRLGRDIVRRVAAFCHFNPAVLLATTTYVLCSHYLLRPPRSAWPTRKTSTRNQGLPAYSYAWSINRAARAQSCTLIGGGAPRCQWSIAVK
jgi:hypothetical protein